MKTADMVSDWLEIPFKWNLIFQIKTWRMGLFCLGLELFMASIFCCVRSRFLARRTTQAPSAVPTHRVLPSHSPYYDHSTRCRNHRHHIACVLRPLHAYGDMQLLAWKLSGMCPVLSLLRDHVWSHPIEPHRTTAQILLSSQQRYTDSTQEYRCQSRQANIPDILSFFRISMIYS